jgi:hypothetical protein
LQLSRLRTGRDEDAARAAGDDVKTRDAHAMVERQTRWLTRLSALPPGENFPFPFTLWRMGDALWLGVEGEPYNLMQRTLRERFPQTPLVVMVLSGARPYFHHETYGKGIYQIDSQSCLWVLKLIAAGSGDWIVN